MTYTTIKIRDDATVIRSDCPRCGKKNTSIIQRGLQHVGEQDVTCLACRKIYRAGIFSTRHGSIEHLAK